MFRRRYSELTYARPDDRLLRRWAIRSLEEASGRRKLVGLYARWQSDLGGARSDAFRSMLDLMRIRLDVVAGRLPLPSEVPERLVIVANHPFGIGDGAALLALAERLNRPFRILVSNDLMKIPEMKAYGLPVSFEETKAAVALNMETRRQAMRLLAEGTTIVVFPAGGVATAAKVFGRAEDLPWKQFTSRLVQAGRACVLPVFFEGQNGPLFHFVSKFSPTLRLGLLIGAFRRLYGREIRVRIGPLLRHEDLAGLGERGAITLRLRDAVFSLGGAGGPRQSPEPSPGSEPAMSLVRTSTSVLSPATTRKSRW